MVAFEAVEIRQGVSHTVLLKNNIEKAHTHPEECQVYKSHH